MAMATAQTPPGKNCFKNKFFFPLMVHVLLKKKELDFFMIILLPIIIVFQE
jgi:hypothetical protein